MIEIYEKGSFTNPIFYYRDTLEKAIEFVEDEFDYVNKYYEGDVIIYESEYLQYQISKVVL